MWKIEMCYLPKVYELTSYSLQEDNELEEFK